MGYFGVKNYGTIVRQLAVLFIGSGNIYDGAKAMLEFGDKYFVSSRNAYHELYKDGGYPNNQKIVTTLFDEYIISDAVKMAFLTKRFANDDLEIEFIRRDIDNAYVMLCNVQMLLQAVSVTAHPENYSEKQLKAAINGVINPILENTIENEQKLRFASFSITTKEYLKRYIEMLEEAAKQEKKQDHDSSKQELGQDKESRETMLNQASQQEKPAYQAARKYVIENNDLLLQIHKFLVETKVLLSDFPVFLDMAINADASNIVPKKKWKFITSLRYIATCIKDDQKAWARDICKSIGQKPSDLTKCAEKDPGWLDDLKILVGKYQ